jgi:hypothetical protein
MEICVSCFYILIIQKQIRFWNQISASTRFKIQVFIQEHGLKILVNLKHIQVCFMKCILVLWQRNRFQYES